MRSTSRSKQFKLFYRPWEKEFVLIPRLFPTPNRLHAGYHDKAFYPGRRHGHVRESLKQVPVPENTQDTVENKRDCIYNKHIIQHILRKEPRPARYLLQFGHKERLFQFVYDALAYGNPEGRYKGHAQKFEQTYAPPESDAIGSKHLYQDEKGDCSKQYSFVHDSRFKYIKYGNARRWRVKPAMTLLWSHGTYIIMQGDGGSSPP